jgi:hypothetical protein
MSGKDTDTYAVYALSGSIQLIKSEIHSNSTDDTYGCVNYSENCVFYIEDSTLIISDGTAVAPIVVSGAALLHINGILRVNIPFDMDIVVSGTVQENDDLTPAFDSDHGA